MKILFMLQKTENCLKKIDIAQCEDIIRYMKNKGVSCRAGSAFSLDGLGLSH